MNILFATPECAPWVKTGGLGDVCGTLPKALSALGQHVRVLIPAFQPLIPLLEKAQSAIDLPAQGPWPSARLLLVQTDGITLWLLHCPALYDRPKGPYLDDQGKDHADNAQRFAFLSHVAASLSGGQSPCADWPVDVLHCHDWTTALAPAYLSLEPGTKAATVVTIHNLLFQGMFPRYMAEQLDLPPAWLSVEGGLLHWGKLCFLKAGLQHADVVTTVSPSYAREIQSEPQGCGLDGMLRLRAPDLVGILNGIDTNIWNPQTDHLIPSPYNAATLARKAPNKLALQKRMGLDTGAKPMLLGLVSRLSAQKGLDLVMQTLPTLLDLGCQLCILGEGDEDLQTALLQWSAAHPGRVAVRIGFDEALAHLIEAGADAFLMPSHFEPCGLNQLYSLAYGTPPIVHAVGGLADSVTDDAQGTGDGFQFDAPTAAAFTDALRRAHQVYLAPQRWRRIQGRAMARDHGWHHSAQRYVEVYEKAMTNRRDRAHRLPMTMSTNPQGEHFV